MLVSILVNSFPIIQSTIDIVSYFQRSRVDPLLDFSLASSEIVRPVFRRVLTLVFLAAQAFVAYLVPGVEVVISILGATLATGIMLAFPAYVMGAILPITPML